MAKIATGYYPGYVYTIYTRLSIVENVLYLFLSGMRSTSKKSKVTSYFAMLPKTNRTFQVLKSKILGQSLYNKACFRHAS